MFQTKRAHWAAFFVVIAFACFLTTAARAESVKLRFATYVVENDLRFKAFERFAQLVKERTEGRVKLELFGGGTLHPFTKAIDAILGGVSDISPICCGAIDARLPCTQATNFMPAEMDMSKSLQFDREYIDIVQDEFAKLGLVIVMPSNFGYDQHWFFTKPIHNLTDMKGLTVRAVGDMTTSLIEHWGGNPVFMPPTEVFQGAERGVVDGVTMGIATLTAWNMWEILPYFVNSQMYYGNVVYTMNKKKFDALRPEDQKAIIETGFDVAEWLKPKYEAWINEDVGRAVFTKGVTVITPTKKERHRIVESAREAWGFDKIDKACGPEKAKKIRAWLDKYEG